MSGLLTVELSWVTTDLGYNIEMQLQAARSCTPVNRTCNCIHFNFSGHYILKTLLFASVLKKGFSQLTIKYYQHFLAVLGILAQYQR